METLGPSFSSLLTKATQKGRQIRDSVIMGMHGPPRQLALADDLVCLYNTAYRVNGQWCAEFVISVFDRHDETKAHAAEETLMPILGVNRGELIWDRIQYFVAVPRENVAVVLRQIGGRSDFQVGPTRSNGIMDPQVILPSEFNHLTQGTVVNFEVLTPPAYEEQHALTTIFAEPYGFGVISGMSLFIRCRLM